MSHPSSPPPPPDWRHLVGRWWVGRHALGRLPYWLLSRGGVVLAACSALYVLNGFLSGWTAAYEVMVGITSPAQVDPQWCAWPLSIAGWAAIPAFVGGAVGYVVTEQIQAHQSQDLTSVLAELRALAEPPAVPPSPPASGSEAPP
ncbi:DUF6313 family protein [Kitasatospora sp. NPDC059088]|uniref:DUF6313 family protein n=1 Tax=Kitasatospora sp. NPDC059088 TaxID=3346722 RepID=UPI0036C27C4F